MSGRWLAYALLAVTLAAGSLAACDTGQDEGSGAAPGGDEPRPAVGDDPTPPDARLGTVALQLAAVEPLSADWELVVRVLDPRGGPAVHEERLAVDAMRRLVYLYLLPDTYNVRAEVIDAATGDVLMSGQADGVVVLAQQTASVAVALEPAAALQILVDLDRGGRRFGCEFLGAAAPPVNDAISLMGAQRLEVDRDGLLRPRYYLWLLSYTTGWHLYRSWQVAPFDFSGAVTLPDHTLGIGSGWHSAVDVGGWFFATGSGSGASADVVVSEDGVHWQKLGVVAVQQTQHSFSHPVTQGGSTWNAWFADYVGDCALLADNQFNLFCGTLDYYLGKTGAGTTIPKKRAGIFQAWSPDAVSWEGFFQSRVPLDDPSIDEAPNVEIAVDLGTKTEPQSVSLYDRPDVIAAALRGGVYQMWFISEQVALDLTHPGPTTFGLVESVDRSHWSQPQTLTFDEAETAPDCQKMGGMRSRFALFTAPDGVHLYSLSWTAAGSPATPDYYSLRHLWSVD